MILMTILIYNSEQNELDLHFRMNSDMIEMSGCSTIDIDIARMFWKSFSLSPPIESKLYSPDIKQRRRTATASGKLSIQIIIEKLIDYLKVVEHQDKKSSKYLIIRITFSPLNTTKKKVKEEVFCISLHKFWYEFLDTIYEKRMETLSLHEKLRRVRLKKEEISARKLFIDVLSINKYIISLGDLEKSFCLGTWNI